MMDRGDVPVAVAATRSTLDLTVNFWIPGFVARTVDSAQDALTLTESGGVLVLDPNDPLTMSVLQLLREQQLTRPIVLLAADASQLTATGHVPPGTIVCATRQVADLAEALAAAAQDASARTSDGEVATSRGSESIWIGKADAAATEPQSRTHLGAEAAPSAPKREADLWGPRADGAGRAADQVDNGERGATQDRADDAGAAPQPVVCSGEQRMRTRRTDRRRRGPGLLGRLAGRLTEESSRGPEAEQRSPSLALERDEADDEAVGQPGESVQEEGPVEAVARPEVERVVELEPDLASQLVLEPWRIARAWLALAALREPHIRSGAALVALRTSKGSFTVVAGVGIAPLDADQVIPSTSPILSWAAGLNGWWIRSHGPRPSSGLTLPLDECDALLALSLDRRELGPDGIVVIGRREAFDEPEATAAAASLRSLEPTLLWSGSPSGGVGSFEGGESAPGAFLGSVPSFAIRSGWRLLDRVFPILGGAGAVVTMKAQRGAYVSTAGVGIDPKAAAAVVNADHELLARLRASGGSIALTTAGGDAQAVSRLPVANLPFIALVARGAVTDPDAILMLGRRRAFAPEELHQLELEIRAHEQWPSAGSERAAHAEARGT